MSHLSVAPDSTAPPRRLINASQANGLAKLPEALPAKAGKARGRRGGAK